MPRLGLTADTIIETAAQIANEIGVDKISIKLLAEKCNIKSPSFYNHFTNLDEIKNSIMLYGWKQLEEKALRAAVGVSGYDAVKAICYAFTNMPRAMRAYSTPCFGTTIFRTKRLIRRHKICSI